MSSKAAVMILGVSRVPNIGPKPISMFLIIIVIYNVYALKVERVIHV